MSASDVFFMDVRTRIGANIFDKLKKMMKKTSYPKFAGKEGNIIAVKLHFGERGNFGYIHPRYVRCFVDDLKKRGKKPFLTDSNSIYLGSRSDAVWHIETALDNGFTYAAVNAPIIIADGLLGKHSVRSTVNLEYFDTVDLAAGVFDAERMLCLTHFKGHELTGFGGALKNIGMGLAAKPGKLAMHSTECPIINKSCIGCGVCSAHCPAQAISINEEKVAVIDESMCIGCGQCIISCPRKCVQLKWDESSDNIQKKICEYAYGVLVQKKLETYFVNFLMNITPACDCFGCSDAVIVPDIGILFSRDPVAIDQASVDMVNAAEGIGNTALHKDAIARGKDKFKGIYPKINWEVQLEYAEKVGLGTREYKLIS